MQTESTHQNPPERAYNTSGLSALQFLRAVMEATHLPMAIRIQAASALLPFTTPYPRPITSVPPAYTLTIPPLSLEPWSHICSPWPRSTANDSQNPSGSHIPLSHGGQAPGPSNLRDDTEPPNFEPFIDYSAPHDPAVFEAAAKYGLPEPHLCSYCGHWLTTTYPDCICADFSARDPSKLN